MVSAAFTSLRCDLGQTPIMLATVAVMLGVFVGFASMYFNVLFHFLVACGAVWAVCLAYYIATWCVMLTCVCWNLVLKRCIVPSSSWWRGVTYRQDDKVVDKCIEAIVSAELLANPLGVDIVDGNGNLTRRVGSSLRVAHEVKLRFGGTPALTEANKLLAARYIDEALVEHGVTRKIDRALMMYKVRALVFTRLAGEKCEDMFLNSRAAMTSHDDADGWHHADQLTFLGFKLPFYANARRRQVKHE